jgi:hypothetical protein
MQSPKTFTISDSLADIEAYLTNLLVFLLACKLTKSLAPQVQQRLDDLDALRPLLRKHLRAVADAEAAVLFVDDELNLILDDAKKETLAHVGNDYGAPLYKQLFGGLSPSELRRFLLGEQLETQRLWTAILGQTSNPKLQQIGVRNGKVVADADQVLAALEQAKAASDAFDAGPLQAFVDACNTTLAAVFGKVLEIYKDPASGPLPPDFVDRFFVRDTSSRAPRLEELDRAIQRLGDRLAKLTAQRDEMKANQGKARKAKLQTEIAAKQARLAAAKQAAEQAAAEMAALEAALAKEEP